VSALASSPVLILVGGVILLAAILLGRRIDVKLGSIHAQLTPNGGHTAKDQIARVDRNVLKIAEHLGIANQIEAPPETSG
jgi:hypothetical protein